MPVPGCGALGRDDGRIWAPIRGSRPSGPELRSHGVGWHSGFPVLRGDAVFRISQTASSPRGLWQATGAAGLCRRKAGLGGPCSILTRWRRQRARTGSGGAQPPRARLQTLSGAAERRRRPQHLARVDVERGSFVEGGFVLRAADLADIAWADESTLLLAAASGPQERAATGYPRAVRLWARGTEPFAAKPVFEGAGTSGAKVASFLTAGRRWPDRDCRDRNPRIADLSPARRKAVRLPVPGGADLQTVTGPYAIFALRASWHGSVAGGLVAFDLAAFEHRGRRG